MTVTLTEPVMEQNEAGAPIVSRTATLGATSAKAQVETSDLAAHGGYAGARAAAELGRQLLDDGDWQGATAAARAGIEALGRAYAPAGTKDDSKLKISAAEDRIKQGHAEDGARALNRALASRISMYEARYGVR